MLLGTSRYAIIEVIDIRIFDHQRAMFETVYGAGLRLSEIVHLRIQDIDSKQMRIFVHHGKGGKDRFTLLSQRNLAVLREYWKQYRPNHPEGYLFFARSKDKHILTCRSVENAFHKYTICEVRRAACHSNLWKVRPTVGH